MKKITALLVSIAIIASVLCAFPVQALALEQIGDSDVCYEYDPSTHTLTIDGVGAMPDFTVFDDDVPWYDVSQEIETVVISEGITRVGNYSLYGVSASRIELPSTLVSIGQYSMAFTVNITTIDLPYGLQNIESDAFYGCNSMTSIEFPYTLNLIGDSAFYGCFSLNNVTIPYSVRRIGDFSFALCSSLTHFRFQSLTSAITIGDYAFYKSSALTHIDVPERAQCGIRFFGFYSEHDIYSNISLGVYNGSDAYNYAVGNDIAYNILSGCPIECGVYYNNVYTEDTVTAVHRYSFVADYTTRYCFYTKGDVDTRVQLVQDGEVIAENDDLSDLDRNFNVEISCTEGDEIEVLVYSYHSVGEYSFICLPTRIASATISGSYHLTDENIRYDRYNKEYYAIKPNLLLGAEFTVQFVNGLVHKFVYEDNFYAGGTIGTPGEIPVEDFSCGANPMPITIRNFVAYFDCTVDHTFKATVVAPTPYNEGYTLHKCVTCDESYKDNFFNEQKPVYTIRGNCYLSENKYGMAFSKYPYDSPVILVNGEEHSINPDGSWEIMTYVSTSLVFVNPYGKDYTIRYTVNKNNPDFDYGSVVLDGYDINADGYINARDYAIYKKELVDRLGEDYWQFADNFVTVR